MVRGFATWRSDPGVMLLGLIPGLIAAAVVATLVVALAVNFEPLTRWIAGFGPSGDLADLTQIFVAIALIWAAVGFFSYDALRGSKKPLPEIPAGA